MTPELREAQRAIASEIGPDVAEFTPADEKHLLVAAAVAALGGTFLTGFFEGFAKAAGSKAGEKLGETLLDFVSEKIAKLRKKDSPEQAEDLERASATAKASLTQNSALTAEQVQAISKAVQDALSAALAQQADADIAARVAGRVRVEAMKTMGVAAAAA